MTRHCATSRSSGDTALYVFQGPLAWISNHNHDFFCDVVAHRFTNSKQFSETAVEVRAWLSNYQALFYMDIITYPFPIPIAGLAKLC